MKCEPLARVGEDSTRYCAYATPLQRPRAYTVGKQAAVEVLNRRAGNDTRAVVWRSHRNYTTRTAKHFGIVNGF